MSEHCDLQRLPEVFAAAATTACILIILYNKDRARNRPLRRIMNGMVYVVCMLIFFIEPVAVPVGLVLSKFLMYLYDLTLNICKARLAVE